MVVPIDRMVGLRAANVLGQTLRADDTDPMKIATVDENGKPNILATN